MHIKAKGIPGCGLVIGRVRRTVHQNRLTPCSRLPAIIRLAGRCRIDHAAVRRIVSRLRGLNLISHGHKSKICIGGITAHSFSGPLGAISLYSKVSLSLSRRPRYIIRRFAILGPSSRMEHRLNLRRRDFAFCVGESRLRSKGPLSVRCLCCPIRVFHSVELATTRASIEP